MASEIDFSGKTLEELREIIQQANDAYYAAERARQQEVDERRNSITDAISTLSGLLGAEGTPAGTDSILARRWRTTPHSPCL